MSVVVINVLTVPEGAGEVLEQRFAARAGAVEKAEGFEGFQLLRPVEGTDRYLVWTRWRSEADFQAWRDSQAFAAGHAQAAQDRRPSDAAPGAGDRPASTGSEVWQLEVVLDVGPA
ncbi:MAG TPA: antibiotic biosynthesis monooxygenase [Mycobacteriales bacterium]|nr:antibiotic biosynthesis monooxygenase [Mycobacteriales bacterium]